MAREDWEAVIGLEIHVQLATESKIFSWAPAGAGEEPNTQVEPVCLGMPGMLPVLNRHAVELALKVGLALGCDVARRSRFARKHYFYPDLPKGYQISQYEEPLCTAGEIVADVDGEEKTFRLTRIHMEEDAGKTIHDARRGQSLVDYNRAGVPLIETVSEPDMRSPEDAVAYMKALHEIVVALGVSDGNMERGNFRCDANVSVRRRGDATLGTKVELKNINSFRFVGRGLAYEIDRQIAELEAGRAIAQETRLWDEAGACTRPMRTKEEAHDYRYFPDPDLMDLVVDEAWLERLEADLPELPRARRARFARDYDLTTYDAEVLTGSAALADYFEAVAVGAGDAKLAANWVQGELSGALNRADLDVAESPVSAEDLVDLLKTLESGKISGKMAKECFAAMFDEGVSVKAWVDEHGGQITDEAEIERLVRGALEDNPDQVTQYREGKTKLLGFFVGQVMKATRGKANPQTVNQVARRLLEESP
ncbi:MAG: Asp-tRNA(Asn)/Glu-tRNA(Gln) amidotransferase subunit GatB [Myxococcota bacterium]